MLAATVALPCSCSDGCPKQAVCCWFLARASRNLDQLAHKGGDALHPFLTNMAWKQGDSKIMKMFCFCIMRCHGFHHCVSIGLSLNSNPLGPAESSTHIVSSCKETQSAVSIEKMLLCARRKKATNSSGSPVVQSKMVSRGLVGEDIAVTSHSSIGGQQSSQAMGWRGWMGHTAIRQGWVSNPAPVESASQTNQRPCWASSQLRCIL